MCVLRRFELLLPYPKFGVAVVVAVATGSKKARTDVGAPPFAAAALQRGAEPLAAARLSGRSLGTVPLLVVITVVAVVLAVPPEEATFPWRGSEAAAAWGCEYACSLVVAMAVAALLLLVMVVVVMAMWW